MINFLHVTRIIVFNIFTFQSWVVLNRLCLALVFNYYELNWLSTAPWLPGITLHLI